MRPHIHNDEKTEKKNSNNKIKKKKKKGKKRTRGYGRGNYHQRKVLNEGFQSEIN